MMRNSRRAPIRLRFFNDNGMAEELRKNLYWVIWSVTIGMVGFVITTGPVWSAFQREVLGANDLQIGLISAIPVAVCVFQVFISYYMEKKRNRRFIFLFLGLGGRAFWLLIALVPYLFPSFPIDLRIWLVIVFVVIIAGANSGANLAFGSLMGDLVPIGIRGSYFGVRSRISLISGVITGLLISVMIDKVGLIGYSIALIIAGITMILDIASYFFVKWPEMDETHLPPLRTLLKDVFSNKRFVKVIVFYSSWVFAINIAAPFWNIHMLEYLDMSFTQMTLYSQIVSSLSSILLVTRWGRLIDRYGNKPILQIAAMFLVLAPIPWLFATSSSTYIIIITSVISGATWPVIEISQQNLYLSQSPRTHRSMYIAIFFACFNLFGIALPNAIGGFLMQSPFAALTAKFPDILGIAVSKMHWMILTSIVLRILVLVVFLPRIHEEGSQTLPGAVKGMHADTAAQMQRRVAVIRNTVLRKRYRRMLKKEALDASNQSK